MNVFDRLEQQYDEIDQTYAAAEFAAASRGWAKKETTEKKKREINDQAYFLFMFTRLEDRIKKEGEKLILRKKNGISSWRVRAPWDILPSDIKDLHFKKCLSFLCERGSAEFSQVVAFYDERNSIAHGGSFTNPISMPTVIAQLKHLYKILRT